MALSVEQTVVTGLRLLPPDQQQEVAEFIQELVRKNTARQTIWDKIDERISQVAPEVWENIPADGAEQHDHYLYGAPKR